MTKTKLSDLNSNELIERKRENLRRYLVTLGLLIIFSIYLIYRDLIKNTEFSYTETYIFVLIGLIAITIEFIYKTRRINLELRLRNK
jgi:hypothetical protein